MNYSDGRVFEALDSALDSYREENGLDVVTVRSLLRGSIDISDDEEEKASVLVVSPEKKRGFSVKSANVKLNFKFALDSIFAFKPIFDEHGKSLVLYLLRAIVFLINNMSVEITEVEAWTAFSIYRKNGVEPKWIMDYINEYRPGEKISIEDVKTALDKLEKIKAIQLEDSKYYLVETLLFVV